LEVAKQQSLKEKGFEKKKNRRPANEIQKNHIVFFFPLKIQIIYNTFFRNFVKNKKNHYFANFQFFFEKHEFFS